MKYLISIVAISLYGLALLSTPVLAGDTDVRVMKTDSVEKIELTLNGKDGSKPVNLNLDSEKMGFKLSDIKNGETRTYTDEKGQVVTMTGTESGTKIQVAGTDIDVVLPPPHKEHHGGMHEKKVWIEKDGDGMHREMETMDMDMGSDREVRVMRMGGPGADHGLMLISPRPLDDATKQSIRDALIAAGITDKLEIMDGSDMQGGAGMSHGEKVHVIKKKVIAN